MTKEKRIERCVSYAEDHVASGAKIYFTDIYQSKRCPNVDICISIAVKAGGQDSPNLVTFNAYSFEYQKLDGSSLNMTRDNCLFKVGDLHSSLEDSGCGSMLIRCAISYAVSNGASAIIGTVDHWVDEQGNFNPDPKRMYLYCKKFGFRIIDQQGSIRLDL